MSELSTGLTLVLGVLLSQQRTALAVDSSIAGRSFGGPVGSIMTEGYFCTFGGVYQKAKCCEHTDHGDRCTFYAPVTNPGIREIGCWGYQGNNVNGEQLTEDRCCFPLPAGQSDC